MHVHWTLEHLIHAEVDIVSLDQRCETALLLLAAVCLRSGQPSDILKKLHPSEDVSRQAEQLHMTSPTLLAMPVNEGHQYFLAVEKQVVLEVKQPADLPGVLLGAYFVFNIDYPEKQKPFFLVTESLLIGKTSEKMTAALKGTVALLRAL
jgi:hypothetical protein